MYGRDWQIAIWDTTHFLKAMRTTLTLNQIVDDWIAGCDRLPATRTDYKRKIRLWFSWLSRQQIEPRSPSRGDILRYKEFLQVQMKSAYTYFSYLTVVQLFYRYCHERGYYDDIGSGIRTHLRQRMHRKNPLTAFQAQRLVESIPTTIIVGKRDKLLVSMMLMLGLRTCELERINICDFGLVDNIPTLRIQRKGHLDKLAILALPQKIVELFEDYIAERNFQEDDPLFINHSRGRVPTRLAKQTISHIVKKQLRMIGIDDPKITAHSLRHTCGSLLVEQGVDIEVIKELLGHTSTATTRIYVDMAMKRRLLEDNPSNVVADIIGEKH